MSTVMSDAEVDRWYEELKWMDDRANRDPSEWVKEAKETLKPEEMAQAQKKLAKSGVKKLVICTDKQLKNKRKSWLQRMREKGYDVDAMDAIERFPDPNVWPDYGPNKKSKSKKKDLE